MFKNRRLYEMIYCKSHNSKGKSLSYFSSLLGSRFRGNDEGDAEKHVLELRVQHDK